MFQVTRSNDPLTGPSLAMKILSEAQQDHIKQKLIKYCKKEGLAYTDHGGAVRVYIPLTKM